MIVIVVIVYHLLYNNILSGLCLPTTALQGILVQKLSI